MENEMKIESKFDENDKVWFFNDADAKFYEGTVTGVSNWDKWSGFRYEVRHGANTSNPTPGNNPITNSVQENKLYASKQEILDNAFVAEPVQ